MNHFIRYYRQLNLNINSSIALIREKLEANIGITLWRSSLLMPTKLQMSAIL